MACCCNSGGGKPSKASAICLGRCDLNKHRCLDREEVKPGPVPKHMGWWYTARDAPEHQLRCGWRPGHISCPVLKKIERHNCLRHGECGSCSSSCNRTPCGSRVPCVKPCCLPPAPSPRCLSVCPSTPYCARSPGCIGQPLIRIIRHAGQYSICTQPPSLTNSPSGPYPLKYVLNTDDEDLTNKSVKFSVEAKFNDYQFDYTSSQTSFVLDFSPPEPRCSSSKACPRKVCA